MGEISFLIHLTGVSFSIMVFIALTAGLINPNIMRYSKNPSRAKIFIFWILSLITVFAFLFVRSKYLDS